MSEGEQNTTGGINQIPRGWVRRSQAGGGAVVAGFCFSPELPSLLQVSAISGRLASYMLILEHEALRTPHSLKRGAKVFFLTLMANYSSLRTGSEFLQDLLPLGIFYERPDNDSEDAPPSQGHPCTIYIAPRSPLPKREKQSDSDSQVNSCGVPITPSPASSGMLYSRNYEAFICLLCSSEGACLASGMATTIISH